MTAQALDLLERLRQAPAKDERLLDLLKDPETDGTPGWFLNVPRCFNDALDIRQTERKVDGKSSLVWTQGTTFSFKAGDVLYCSPAGHETWAESMAVIKVCVQIKAASKATSGDGQRNPGTVAFERFHPCPENKRLVCSDRHATTQDGFVRFLITGEVAGADR